MIFCLLFVGKSVSDSAIGYVQQKVAKSNLSPEVSTG